MPNPHIVLVDLRHAIMRPENARKEFGKAWTGNWHQLFKGMVLARRKEVKEATEYEKKAFEWFALELMPSCDPW